MAQSRIIRSRWGQQSVFRGEVQALARAVFDELDPGLGPEVFLIGLVADHEDGVYPLFMDTPGEEYSPRLFQEASTRSAAIRKELYEEAGIEGSPPEGDRRRRIVLEAWRRAVEEVLAEQDDGEAVVSFCSSPRPVEEFLVCTVLRLQRSVWEAYYALRKDEADLKARRPASLLDATVEQFMRRCVVGLAERHAGMSASLVDSDPEEILRAAGRLLADAPALGGQRNLELRGLFHACNTISTMHYEGQSTRGQLLISAPEHPDIDVRVRVRRPVNLQDHVAVRKLLETNRPGYALLCDGAAVYGLGSHDLQASTPDLGLFFVTFVKHYTWELGYGMRTLMQVSYGHPRLAQSPIREDVFRRTLTRTFGALPPANVDRLWAVASAASEQPHGTLLVITAGAAAEAERLGKQGAPLEPCAPDPEGVLSLTSVDGALLADPGGSFHAFGVILDGKATARGNPARGARYNSALRYVGSSKHPCLAVVVSEDGSVDLLSTADDVPEA